MSKKILSGLLLTVMFANCSKEFSEKEEIPVAVQENVSFNKDNSVLSFSSSNLFEKYMETYEQNEKEIEKFYADGFVPYKPIETINEETFLELNQKKQAILATEKGSLFHYNSSLTRKSKETDEDYDEEDDMFITNDKFASLLNAKGEIIVNDTIYRFTPVGRFSSHISKKYLLDDYIDKLSLDTEFSEGTVFVTKDIQRFIPLREQFKNYEIVQNENEDVSFEDENQLQKRLTSRALPTDTNHYNSCNNSRSHWIDRIFGVSYTCEYQFTKKRKLRTTFAVENYGFYMEVYAQAKFKQKTWFGWYSSRDAEKVYLRVNHAALTFEQKEVSINRNDVENAINYGKQIVKWFKRSDVTPVVNAISTPNGGARTYTSNENDFNDAENSWSWWRRMVNLPKVYMNQAEPEIKIDFSGVFDQRTQNVVVLSIFDKKYNLTNKDIMKAAFNELKSMGSLLENKPTGVFLVEHDTQLGKIKSRSYTLFDQIHESKGLAIVRNNFKVPQKMRIDGLLLSFSSNNGKNKVDAKADFSYPVVKNIDLSIETGAFYDGRWAGSKLTVVHNR